MDSIPSQIIDRYLDVAYNSSLREKQPYSESDKVLGYVQQLLSLGSMYLEFADAVKEGDGKRIIRCWRYLMVIFRAANRKNYAKEAFHLLYEYQYVLSPSQKEQLLYSRFINIRGKLGSNISADLHMEHLNREVKQCNTSLKSNKDENSILRVGKALGRLSPVLNGFDKVTTSRNTKQNTHVHR